MFILFVIIHLPFHSSFSFLYAVICQISVYYCFSRSVFTFSYLISKYLNTLLISVLRSTWSAFLSHFLSDSSPPFCLGFYFTVSFSTARFAHLCHLFYMGSSEIRSPDPWTMHLIVSWWRGPLLIRYCNAQADSLIGPENLNREAKDRGGVEVLIVNWYLVRAPKAAF